MAASCMSRLPFYEDCPNLIKEIMSSSRTMHIDLKY
eukprot:COSAG05_NODE_19227_length_296_cov_0.477157_2_plen_35_part_01